MFWDTASASERAWRPCCHMYAFGKHLVGDRDSGVLYEMDVTSGLDADEAPIRRVRRPPALFDENRILRIAEFEVYLEAGLGLPGAATVQGNDPQVMLRFSPNGKRWGNTRTRSAGKQGEFDSGVIFSMVGSGRSPQVEVSVTDPIPWRLIDAFVRVGRAA